MHINLESIPKLGRADFFPVSPILADLVYLYPVVLTGKSKEMIGL